MSEELKSKIKELEEKVRLLEIENSDWTGRAEDVFLFASTAESISELSTPHEIFESALEKISILKNIPYCAFGTLGNGKINIEFEYASFSEDEKSIQITLSPKTKAKLLEKSTIIESCLSTNSDIKIEVKNSNFKPVSCLIHTYTNLRNEDGIFICLDSDTADRLDTIKSTLLHSVTLVNSRLDNLLLLDKVTEQNRNLEIRIAESMGELEEEIKEHIRTEKGLRESEEKYKTLADYTFDWEYWIDETGNYKYISPSFEKLTGYTPAELTQNPKLLFDFVDNEFKEEVKKHYSKIQDRENDPNILHFKIITKSGEVKWLGHHCVPVYNSDGKFIGRRGSNRDITERKKSQEALLISEKKYRLFLENNDAIILMLNPKNSEIIFANSAAIKFYGYKKDELIGMHISKLNTMKSEDIKKKFAESLKKDKNYFNFKHRLANGEIRDVEVYQTKFEFQNEMFFSIIIHDISVRIKAEKELIISESKFRALFHAINDAVLVHPLLNEGFDNFVEVNDVAVGRYGYSREEFLNMSPKELSEESEANYRGTKAGRKQILETGSMLFESIHIAKSGKQIQVEINSQIFKMGNKKYIMSLVRDITERKQSENKLKESEEKFRAVTQSANDAIVTVDNKGTILNWNNGAEKIFGYTVAEITGKNVTAIIPQSYVELHINGMKRLEQGGKYHVVGKTVELHGIHKYGKEFPLELSLAEWETSSGKFFTGIIRDTTERKESEKILLQNQHFLKLITENAYDFIWTIDMNMNITYATDSCYRMLGYTQDEIKKINIEELYSDDNFNRIQEILTVELAKGIPHEGIKFIIKHKRKNGEQFPAEVQAKIIYNEDNIPVFIQGYTRDITEQVKAQNEIIASKERYNKLSNLTYEGILIHSQGVVIDANKALEKITGYTAEEFIGENIIQLLVPIKYREMVIENMQNQIATPYEIEINKKDGSIVSVEIESRNIFYSSKIPNARVSAIRDISKRKEDEEELRKSKEKAENANKMKDIFLAQMSHEIRTPINALVSMSSLLRYDFEENADEDQLMSFDVIDRAGGRIIRTIDLLLNLSEIQAGTYELVTTQFDIVSDILSILIAEYKKPAKKKNINLKLENNMVDTELVADSYTVNQIFTQLIDNAVKYTEEGEVKIKTLRNESDQLVVEIQDTGIGIHDEYLPDLFKPFSQEEMGYTRKFEGNGIGMALVKKYCQLNNAKIEVESKKGVGSTFRVVFSEN